MRMGQGVRTGLGHGGITCVLQTQFSSFLFHLTPFVKLTVRVSMRSTYHSLSSSSLAQPVLLISLTMSILNSI